MLSKGDPMKSGRRALVRMGSLILASSFAPWCPGEQIKFNEGAKVAAEPIYKPPNRGAAGGRVGGGSRGTGRDIFQLCVLAPDHTALTTQSQPTLFWFTSAPISLPIEVSIIDPTA